MKERPDTFIAAKRSDQLQRKILMAIALVIFTGIGYKIYSYIVHQASSYAGYYRNTKHLFSITFPNTGWYHYSPEDIRNDAFKDAHDAFYSGNNPRDPKLLLVIWAEGMPNPIPDRLDEESASKIMDALEEEFQKRMKKSGMDCEITEIGRRRIGENDGFYLRANLKDKKVQAKTILFCAYNNRRAYTIQFIGNGKNLPDRAQEIDEMITSFSFKVSII